MRHHRTNGRRRAADRARPRATGGSARPLGAGVRAGRRRDREDPGDHAPDRLRGRDGDGQPRAGAGADVHRPRRRGAARAAARARRRRGGGQGDHVPRGRPAPAHLLLAAGDRRPPAAAGGVEAAAAPGGRAGPGTARRGARARRGGDRDRVGEGLPGAPRLLRVRGDRGQAGAVGRRRGHRAAVRGVRGAAPGPAADRLRVGARADGGDPAQRARRRPRGARRLPLFHRGRVPGREPAAEAAARRLARRPRGAVRGRRPAADDLLVHRGHVRVPAVVHGRLPHGHDGPAGPRLPVDPAGGGRGQPAGGRPGERRPARPAVRPSPAPPTPARSSRSGRQDRSPW